MRDDEGMRTRARLLAAAFVALCLLLVGCGTIGGDRDRATEPARAASPVPMPAPLSSGAASPGPTASRPGAQDVGARPYELVVPPTYDAAVPAPLVMVLHGYGSTGAEVDAVLGLRAEAAERGALYVLPEGTADSGDRQFWNATQACCNFSGSDVDDSAYLADVLRDVAATYSVDPAHVVVAGHSNGGFMAYRLACEHADLVTHAVSVAGAMTSDTGACAPSRPVSVLQVHGTRDSTIRYEGGSNGPFPYPSALASVEAWARLDGCSTQAERPNRALDLDMLPGADTSVTAFPRCDDGADVELWSIDGAGHVPRFGTDFPGALLDHVLDGT